MRLKAYQSVLVLGFALAAAGSPLRAQTAGEAPDAAEAAKTGCEVVAVPMATGPQMLEAHCGTQALLLGSADTYSVAANPDLDATVVDMGAGAGRRILLLRMRDDGGPVVEDITTTIALAAGKGRISPIDDVAVDLDAFAGEGKLSVEAQPAGEAEGAVPQTQTIDVGDQVALEQASEAAVPAQ